MRTEIPAEHVVSCDRCGIEMTKAPERMELKVFSVVLAMQGTVDAGPGPYSGQTLDLCGRCLRRFAGFMRDGKDG